MNMRSIPWYTLVWGARYLSKNMVFPKKNKGEIKKLTHFIMSCFPYSILYKICLTSNRE